SFLAADAHKWMLGPEGAAIFYCAAEARDLLEPLESGWMNIQHAREFRGSPGNLLADGRRFEAGSLSTNTIYGATASLALLEETGIEEIEREVIRLATRLADGLERSGISIGTPRPIRSGIVAAVPPVVDSERLKALSTQGLPANVRLSSLGAIHRWLEHKGVVCASREGFLRFSPHFYNDDGEVDRVIDLMASLL
ncbi:MAG: aminotransferase class V-fold PLP-dependent enzyme, partial [Acidobacteriota bacterium]